MSAAMLAHVLTRRASDVMRSPVPTVGPDDRLARAAEFMATFSVRELPVVEGQVLVGIVTRTDLEPYVGQLEWTTVRIAMTSQPRTVTPDVSVRVVAQALLDGGFNGIPVVVDRVLAGMINRHDLLRMLAECPVDAG